MLRWQGSLIYEEPSQIQCDRGLELPIRLGLRRAKTLIKQIEGIALIEDILTEENLQARYLVRLSNLQFKRLYKVVSVYEEKVLPPVGAFRFSNSQEVSTQIALGPTIKQYLPMKPV